MCFRLNICLDERSLKSKKIIMTKIKKLSNDEKIPSSWYFCHLT